MASSQYRVAFDFSGQDVEELTVKGGTLVLGLEPPEDGWLKVKVLSGIAKIGFVPLSYLKPVAPASATAAQPAAFSDLAPSYSPSEPSAPPIASNAPPRNIDSRNIEFANTLDLWKERERRFLTGEAQRLPPRKCREYYYVDRQGRRLGPFTDAEMRAKFDRRQLALDTPLTMSTAGTETLPTRALADFFPNASEAFTTTPAVAAASNMWCYIDEAGGPQGPFASQQMREWFQEGYFNAETMVKFADEADGAYRCLGQIFPSGKGAFLSRGAVANPAAAGSNRTMSLLGSSGVAANSPGVAATVATARNGGAGQGVQQSIVGWDGAVESATANPFDSMLAPAQTPALSSIPASATPFEYDFRAFDPFSAPADTQMAPRTKTSSAGKELLRNALSESANDSPSGEVTQDEDWGFSWDDSEAAAMPVPVTEDQSEQEASPKVETTASKSNPTKMATERVRENLVLSKYADIQTHYLKDVDSLYRFLTRPLSEELGTVRCTIVRSLKGMHVNYNTYELFLERDDGSRAAQILTAHRHKKHGFDSYFKLAIGSVNHREAGTVISEMQFNTMGTAFVMHNNVPAHNGRPRDLCCITYKKNIGKGPRKMQVAIPKFREGSTTEQIEFGHVGGVKKSKLLKALASLDLMQVQPLINKPPVWNRKHRAWTLNFHGRVTKSSVKNFQLVRPEEHDHVVLQHGRVAADKFTMDMAHPISPIVAFSICVSSLHAKLGVE